MATFMIEFAVSVSGHLFALTRAERVRILEPRRPVGVARLADAGVL